MITETRIGIVTKPTGCNLRGERVSLSPAEFEALRRRGRIRAAEAHEMPTESLKAPAAQATPAHKGKKEKPA